MKKRNIAVLGLGIFGITLAKELSENGCDVLVMDQKESLVDEVADDVTKAVVGDITSLEFLESIGVGDCDAVVIAIGTNLESAVLAVMHCQTLGVKRIMAKAKNKLFEKVLKALGVTEIITPEKDAGRSVARHLSNNILIDLFELDNHISIVEFHVPNKWVGKSILELNVRQNYNNMNIIGIKQDETSQLIVNFDVTQKLETTNYIQAIVETSAFLSDDMFKS